MPGGGPIHSPRSCEEGDVKDALVRSMFAAISVAGRGERARFLERLGLVSASPAAEPARSPRDGERNRTRHSFSAFPRPDGFGARAVVCLPASFWLVPCPASSPRGPSSRRLAALLSAVEGHRPLLALPEALDFGRRGDRGARRGQGGRVGDGEGRFEFRRALLSYLTLLRKRVALSNPNDPRLQCLLNVRQTLCENCDGCTDFERQLLCSPLLPKTL